MRFRRQYTLYPVRNKKGKTFWYFRIYINDKRKARTTGCASKEKARMYVEALLNEPNHLRLKSIFGRELGMWLDSKAPTETSLMAFPSPSKAMTFGEYARNWWLWDKCPYVLDRRMAGTADHPKIKRSYVATGRLWTTRYLIPYFGQFRLDEINVDMVNQFLVVLKEKHKVSPKTINNIRSIMMIMMEEAVKKEMIGLNPVKGTVSRCVDAVKRELLTDKEYRRLFNPDSIDELWGGRLHYYVYNLISSLTGMRAGELLALTIDDVSQNEIRIAKNYSAEFGMGTTKNSEKRRIPITDDMYRLMMAVNYSHPDSRYIFSISSRDKPMGEGNSRKALYSALEKMGIDKKERERRHLTFHSWRHKFVTDCVINNMHVEKIKALTGHKTNSMISHYTDLNANEDILEINEIQKNMFKIGK